PRGRGLSKRVRFESCPRPRLSPRPLPARHLSQSHVDQALSLARPHGRAHRGLPRCRARCPRRRLPAPPHVGLNPLGDLPAVRWCSMGVLCFLTHALLLGPCRLPPSPFPSITRGRTIAC